MTFTSLLLQPYVKMMTFWGFHHFTVIMTKCDGLTNAMPLLLANNP